MSQENVEIVRRAWEAAASRPPDFQTVNTLYHPDHVLQSDFGAIEARTYRGATGYAQALADMNEAWDEWTQEIDELIDAGPQSVVIAARLVARGKRSTTPVERRYGVVVSLRGGKIISTQAFLSVPEALEAAGLSEQDAHADS
jgi:ketosteroid isomerase-like protein